MSGWQERLGDRGKAMIALVVVPLLLPAVAASFHAIRLWTNTEQVNPSIASYYQLIEQTDGALASLEAKVREEESDNDWQDLMKKLRLQHEEDEQRKQRAREAAPQRPKAVMLGHLALQGIFWKEGRPIVYVNHELVELNEKVDGWEVTHIGKDKMVVVDPEGREKTYDLDMVLEQLYPGYRRP